MDIFAARLKILVSDSDVKQKAVAKYLQVSEGTLSNYIKGIHEPSFDSVVKLARFFNVTTDYLFGLAERPEPPLALSAPERDLIQGFRALSQNDRAFVTQLVQLRLEEHTPSENL